MKSKTHHCSATGRRLNYFERKIVFNKIGIPSDDSLNLDLQSISDNLLECGPAEWLYPISSGYN